MQRKPDAQKQLTGTFRKDRSRGAAKADGAGNPPRMPSGLSDDERRIWRALVGLESLRERLQPEDTHILLSLVQSLALRDLAYKDMVDNGITSVDERGLTRKNPAFMIWRQAESEARACMMRLGLTVRDRQAINAPPAATEPSEFEKYLARRPRGIDND